MAVLTLQISYLLLEAEPDCNAHLIKFSLTLSHYFEKGFFIITILKSILIHLLNKSIRI